MAFITVQLELIDAYAVFDTLYTVLVTVQFELTDAYVVFVVSYDELAVV